MREFLNIKYFVCSSYTVPFRLSLFVEEYDEDEDDCDCDCCCCWPLALPVNFDLLPSVDWKRIDDDEVKERAKTGDDDDDVTLVVAGENLRSMVFIS